MSKKTYRPKADAEGLSLTVQMGEGETLDVSSWPYTTEDYREQAALDQHPLVTDRPASTKKGDDA